ncbi:MAG: 2-amino-4-hydroxy-6-hydroxymethyldihydropteridine diphosphokinase [Candidatus Thiodiazotropha sp. (ex Gloverina cf. vestifex)]|nr:2-amino-4-hydroxy-6-hydroxymethyldihydropteridine diphosphokinase [Candidatus Thiodiazotropha sp. (ex Gloverina cf. vestifex)]
MIKPDRVTAYVGLGSNLEQPQSQVLKALTELAHLPNISLTEKSSLYCSSPVGPSDQPDFINAVASLLTALSPEELLDELQSLEQMHGRKRQSMRWGPRTLDLDLLLFSDMTIDTARLQVPHPRIAERAFVLYPLAEIAPGDLMIPGVGLLNNLLESISETGIERIA